MDRDSLKTYLVQMTHPRFTALCFWLGVPRSEGISQLSCARERSQALLQWLEQRRRLPDLYQELTLENYLTEAAQPFLAQPPRPPQGLSIPRAEPISWSDWL